jgi:hypothetical protein
MSHSRAGRTRRRRATRQRSMAAMASREALGRCTRGAYAVCRVHVSPVAVTGTRPAFISSATWSPQRRTDRATCAVPSVG